METRLPQVNVVVIGHIDHGKSTLTGRMVYDSGGLKPDRLEEIKNVLKKLNKEKFEYAFILDTFQEEREDEMTIDTVQVPFSSGKYFYNFIDCPGHKEFVKNMISGASQGDMALFVVSAKPGEGVQSQSKEHAWLAKRLGIERMVVAVNKMDTVNYDKSKFDSIVSDIKGTLGPMGYDIGRMTFVPVSAMEGDNVFKRSPNTGWYSGPTLIEALDSSAVVYSPPVDKPLRIPVQDSYSIGQESVIVGRVESGKVRVGDEVVLMPGNRTGIVDSIMMWNQEKGEAVAGDNVGLRVGEISGVKRGYVFGTPGSVPNVSKEFSAEVFVLEEGGEIRKGRDYIIRCGTNSAQCKAKDILNKIDPRSGKVADGNVDMLVMDDAGTVVFSSPDSIAVEKYSDFSQLGRIIIRDEGSTIGIGIVVATN